MLIDSTHRKWLVATLLLAGCAVGFYWYCSREVPGGLTGGSTVGLWYGAVATALMCYAGALSFLRRVPGWSWLGPRQTWLRGHIWLGSLAAVFVLCHSGFRWGGTLEVILWVVLILTLATGVLGVLLQAWLPRMLTRTIATEVPYGQIPAVCGRLLRRAESLIAEIQKEGELSEQYREHVVRFLQTQVKPFLGQAYDASSPLADPVRSARLFEQLADDPGLLLLKDELELLQAYCDQRRQLGEQERIHRLLHGWLLLHVPLSVILFVLTAIHAVMSVKY